MFVEINVLGLYKKKQIGRFKLWSTADGRSSAPSFGGPKGAVRQPARGELLGIPSELQFEGNFMGEVDGQPSTVDLLCENLQACQVKKKVGYGQVFLRLNDQTQVLEDSFSHIF